MANPLESNQKNPESNSTGFDTFSKLKELISSPEGILTKLKSLFKDSFLGKIFNFLDANPNTENLAHHKLDKDQASILEDPKQLFKQLNNGEPISTSGLETLYLTPPEQKEGPTTIYFHGSTRNTPPNYDQFSNNLKSNTDKITGALVAPRCGQGALPLATRFSEFQKEAINNLSQAGYQTTKINLACHSFGLQVLLGNFDSISSDLPNPPNLYISDPVIHKQNAPKLAELIKSGKVGKVYIRYGAISAEKQAGAQALMQELGGNEIAEQGNYINRKLGVSIMKVNSNINHTTAKRYIGKMMEGYA